MPEVTRAENQRKKGVNIGNGNFEFFGNLGGGAIRSRQIQVLEAGLSLQIFEINQMIV